MLDVLYLDPLTGFVSEEPGDGLRPIYLEQPLPWYSTLSGDDLLAWYAQHVARCDAEEASIDAEADRLVAAIEAQRAARRRIVDARRRSVEWLLGHRVRAEVDSRLTGRRRSIDTAWGRLGRRRSERVDVFDESAAIAYARQALPEALIIRESVLKTPFKALLKDGRSVPGVELIQEDKFFCSPAGGAE